MGRRAWSAAGLVAAAAAFVLGSARGDAPDENDVPVGTVAAFSGGTCPEGWAAFDDAAGRVLVGANEGSSVNVVVGKPLADREDRTHTHAYTASVPLNAKGLFAADGSNNDGAAPKTYKVTGTTAPKTSGLAFIQVQTCVKR